MKMPGWLERWGERVIVPVALVIVYTLFIVTADARGPAVLVAAAFLAFVLFLWFSFRRLKLHAQASRLAGVGDGDGLLKLIERELPRALTEGGRRPLHVHAAIAHNLRGDLAAARKELVASGYLTMTKGRHGRGWIALAAAADVTTRTEQGDVAGARASLQRLAPFAALAPFGGMDLVAREAEARILLAEGKPAEARERIAPLVKNIRLMDGTRAVVHALLARAADALGEADEAKSQRDKARALSAHVRL
jgi:hypothetical protein